LGGRNIVEGSLRVKEIPTFLPCGIALSAFGNPMEGPVPGGPECGENAVH